MPFNVNEIEREAADEIAKERGEAAKKQIKDKLRQIASAQRVVDNLTDELEVLKRDLATQ